MKACFKYNERINLCMAVIGNDFPILEYNTQYDSAMLPAFQRNRSALRKYVGAVFACILDILTFSHSSIAGMLRYIERQQSEGGLPV